jgi:hypothetical protein
MPASRKQTVVRRRRTVKRLSEQEAEQAGFLIDELGDFERELETGIEGKSCRFWIDCNALK